MASVKVKERKSWQKELRCSFCDDAFAECRRRTVFCKNCIQESVKAVVEASLEADYNEQLDAVSCPFCRTPISVQLRSDDIISNCKEKIMQVIKVLSKQNEDVANQIWHSDSDEFGVVMIGCGKCEETSPAISWCATCSSTLCWQCDQVHGKWREFKAHKTIPIDEYQKRQRKKQAAAKRPKYCKIHSERPLNLYCKTCSTLICHDCTLKDHRHHKFVTSANKATDKRELRSSTKTVSTRATLKYNHLLISAGAASSSTEITAAKSPHKQPRYPLCVMNKDYKSTSHTEFPFNFNKGDLLYILSTDKDKWHVRAKHSGQEGYIPSSYVTEYKVWIKEDSRISSARGPSPKFPLFVGKHSYNSHADDELSFKKGDLLYIINTDEGDWWYARSKHTNQEGYIPNNYVVEFKSLDAEDWYFGATTRKEAEKQLMQPFNAYGSFLIRDSDTTPGTYTLAVRDTEKVKHYKILKLDGGGFYVNPQVTFEDIPKLVDYYSQHTDVLCVNLKAAYLHDKPPPAVDAWEIDKRSIYLVKKLSDTSPVREVWQGIWKSVTPVAVKMLKPGTISATEFLEEATLMKKLKHPNVIQLYGECSQGESIYIVMELMKHGSLLEYLRGDGRSLTLPQIIDMAAQVAAGMAYLERKHCIHRDLAISNILVSENLICKVADFGLAKFTDGHTPDAHKFDVWFFGILLYELITYGCFPYPNAEVLKAFESGKCIPYEPYPISCPEQFYKIMEECWRDDAASRPTFRMLQKQLETYN